jgi:hypothetical protein
MTWTDEGQDNRVHKDAVETIEKVIQSAKTILADEFAIQQMEYDELYGVNSKEYIAYQNLVTNYLNHRGLLADLDAGKLMAPGTAAPKPPAPTVAGFPSTTPLPLSSDPNLPVPAPQAAVAGFPSQSMAAFERQVEGFNDSIFEQSGARSSLEFNPDATPPLEPERVSELPIPPDAELPRLLTVPVTKADYDPEFLPLQASIQVDEQVANAAAMIASAEPDPSYASGSWSIPSQIQAPLPEVLPLPAVESDPYASGSWAALSQPANMPLEPPGHVQQFAQPPGQQAPSPWAPISPTPPAQPAPVPAPAADYNPWNPLPGSSQDAEPVPGPAPSPIPAPAPIPAPVPAQDTFAAGQPQQSPYATDPNSDKWETGGWATISTPGNGVSGGASNGGAGSAFATPSPEPAPSVFQWAAPEQNQFQTQQFPAKEEDEKKKDDNSAFTFDPTKAWE